MYKSMNFMSLDLTWLDEHRDLKLCYVMHNDNKVDEHGDVTYYGYRLYFTPVDLKYQWGDDWDDAPYEYNSEIPYDSAWIDGDDGKQKRIDFTIYGLQIYVKPENCPNLPEDYAYNSPFSVDMINSRAVAWMYFEGNYKKCNGVSVLAGMSPWDVYKTICNYMVNLDSESK